MNKIEGGTRTFLAGGLLLTGIISLIGGIEFKRSSNPKTQTDHIGIISREEMTIEAMGNEQLLLTISESAAGLILLAGPGGLVRRRNHTHV